MLKYYTMFFPKYSNNFSEDQLSRFTGYPVNLQIFEGPLDLLLYLIRRQEIDITDIPITKITEQFIDYLALLEKFDIEIAAEFLVMAATLLEIKSRVLLPHPPQMTEVDEEAFEDPRAELVRKLLEYQQYKAAAGVLTQRAEEEKLLFPRTSIVPQLSFARPEPLLAGNPDAFSLWSALQSVLARVETTGYSVREVLRPKITIRKQMMLILTLLDENPLGIAFSRLFTLQDGETGITRIAVIITFLALLELMRLHRISVLQDALFDEIYLRLDDE